MWTERLFLLSEQLGESSRLTWRPAISPHVLPDSITILAHWVRPYAQTKPYIRESYCGASLFVTSRSCNYSLNIDPIGAELVVVIRMYAEGHWVAVQWGDVSEESDGHSPPSSDDLNLVCDLWAILNWDQDGCQHSSLTQKVRTRVTTWVRTKSKARILVQSNWAYQGKSTELTRLDNSPVKQPLRCWASWIRIKRIELKRW